MVFRITENYEPNMNFRSFEKIFLSDFRIHSVYRISSAPFQIGSKTDGKSTRYLPYLVLFLFVSTIILLPWWTSRELHSGLTEFTCGFYILSPSKNLVGQAATNSPLVRHVPKSPFTGLRNRNPGKVPHLKWRPYSVRGKRNRTLQR